MPQLAKILAQWDPQHTVIRSLRAFGGSKKVNQRQKPSEWLVALGLRLTPEVELALESATFSLMQHETLAHIHYEERTSRITGVGTALLQCLVVQHELGEPLNLNGDLVNDLWDDSVVARKSDSKAALHAMYVAVCADEALPGADSSQKMSRFFIRHTIVDKEWRPPLYHRIRDSEFMPTEAILVTVPEGLKRKAEEQLEGLNGLKRSKVDVKAKKSKAKAPRKKTVSTAETSAAPGRVLRTRKKAGAV
ncbi:hypothetical protein B0H16DRAFT_1731302 [Mycena metata]|uniref:Uncharacterized protein n=1 Tax=Mycena metata TaxID=1033252 RepID=A0AAD7I5K7_9AGAR|nr:hypothetical protein B0H16DRAFT_1731302 [Mycena metata]